MQLVKDPDLDADKWWDKIRSAENLRDEALSKYDDMVAAYHTPLYEKGGKSLLKNHYFEYIALRIAARAYHNPMVTVDTNLSGGRRVEARGYQHAMNQWLRDTNFRDIAERLSVNYDFSWSVAVTTSEPRPGEDSFEDPIYWPSVMEVDNRLFAFDPCSRTYGDAKWASHAVVARKSELLDRADQDNERGVDGQWDISAINSMVVGEFPKDYSRFEKDSDESERSVCYYNVWVPSMKVDESKTSAMGYHGAWLTLGYCMSGGRKSAKMLRPPRDAWVPRWGPYTLIGCYTVPGKPWPLSALLPTWRLVEETNAHMQTISRAQRNYKRLVFVKETNTKLADAIKSGKHDYIYPVTNFEANQASQYEVAGATTEMVQVAEMFSKWLDTESGISDPQRGNVSGDATATENAIANVASTTREAWQVNKFDSGIERLLTTVLWYIVNDDRIVSALGDEAQRDIEMKDGDQAFHVGGKITPESWPGMRKRLVRMMPAIAAQLPPDEDPPISSDAGRGIDDLRLRIVRGSMAYKDEAASRAQAMDRITVVGLIGQQMMMNPHAKWDDILEDNAADLGMPNLASYFDFGEAGRMSAIQTAGMMGGGSAGGGQAAEQSHNQARPMASKLTTRQGPDTRSRKAALPGNKSGQQAGSGAQKRQRGAG